MLVLSRCESERIVIGDNIEIEVLEIRGKKVRLGLTAPKTVPIHRGEVARAIADATKVNDIEQCAAASA